MQRRDFSKLVGTGIALPALSQVAGQGPRRISTAMITGPSGAHLNYYFESLALADEVSSVSFCDPSGESSAMARKMLGAKLTNSYPDLASLFRKEKPDLALISMEGVTSPPAIDAALDAGCHVLAEKPGCVHVEDFEKLNRKAKAHKRELLLALGNRVDPVMIEAQRIVHEGKIGKVYGVEVHLIADHTRLTKPGYGKEWRAQKARAGGGHLHGPFDVTSVEANLVDSLCRANVTQFRRGLMRILRVLDDILGHVAVPSFDSAFGEITRVAEILAA